MTDVSYTLMLWDMPATVLKDVVASGVKVNEPDSFGEYPLTVAAARLQVASVEVLSNAGADPNVQNFERDTPLLCAIDVVHHNPAAAIAIVEKLAAAGAHLELRGYMD